jgi:hypothetical protein
MRTYLFSLALAVAFLAGAPTLSAYIHYDRLTEL